MPVEVKICGLKDVAAVDAAAEAGARYLGFVFFPPSPRAVTPAQAAPLCAHAPVGVARVGLFVKPTDAEIDAAMDVVPLDMVQIHGVSDPARLRAIRARAGLPTIAAAAVADAADLDAAADLAGVADMMLLDAKAPKDATLPGGNGVAFDWRLLAGRRLRFPWMLAGGLTPQSVAEAIRLTGASRVDVSSGVESAPGVKSPEAIRAFVAAALSA